MGSVRGFAKTEAYLENAQKIDRAVDQVLSQLDKTQNAPVSDAIFLRRAYLQLTGRIPTLKEATAFHNDNSESKRQELILSLAQHPGMNSHLSNWMMDLLRLKQETKVGPVFYSNEPLIHWVRNAIEKNTPWNSMTKDLLSQRGNAWLNGGASGFYTRDAGMPLDNLANTVRVFNGIRLECAQCHDDPKGEWDRFDFYSLAAFTNGREFIHKKHIQKSFKTFRKLSNEEEFKGGGFPAINFFNFTLLQYAQYGINEQKGSGRIKVPKDYQYDDAEKGSFIHASTPYGSKLKVKKKTPQNDPLEKFADWVTNEENEYFAATLASRLWTLVMGSPLTSGDNLEEYLDLSHPVLKPLNTALVQLVKDTHYQPKDILTTLALTKTFAAKAQPDTKGNPHGLIGRKVERLSSEKVWDSLITLIKKHPEKRVRQENHKDLYYKNQYLGPLEDIVKELQKEQSPEDYQQFVISKYKELREKKNPPAPEGSVKPERFIRGGRLMTTAVKGLARASELPSPTNPNHFLRKFGQSDRISIDGATKEGSISHYLELLNGEVQRHVVHKKNATVQKNLRSAKGFRKKLDVLFLSTLSRYPTEQEFKFCQQEFQERKYQGLLNVLSGLITSHEFLYLR